MHTSECNKPESVRLLMLNKIGEPPGNPDHNITYEHDLVVICPACNGATLERLRHDCLDFEEMWDQYEWYELTPEDGARLRDITARCAKPLDPHCSCKIHRSLRAAVTALPVSTWDAVFEGDAHRHMITLVDGKHPSFSLQGRGYAVSNAAQAPATAGRAANTVDGQNIVFVFLLWPLLYVSALIGWFMTGDWPVLADTIIVVLAFPLTFILAVMLAAVIDMLSGEQHKPEN
jgi:hypothetical protein